CDVRMCRQRPLRGKRLPFASLYTNVHCLPCHGRRSLGEFSSRAIGVRIIRAPHDVAGPDAMDLHGAAAEGKFDRSILADRGPKKTAAFFRLFGTSPIRGIEYNAVAGFDRRDSMSVSRSNEDAIALHTQHLTNLYTAMARGTALDHRLVIGAREEIG